MTKMNIRKYVSLLLASAFTGFMICGSHDSFNPVDYFLISCGSSKNITFQGRIFVPDTIQSSFLLRSQGNSTIVSPSFSVPSPIYESMRVFPAPASYEFKIRKKGRHWVRLYFSPSRDFENFESASLTVVTEKFVLLNSYNFKKHNPFLFKEYVIEVDSNILTITFIPSTNSVTYVSGIEVISVPDELFSHKVPAITISGPYRGVSQFSDLALETVHRLNMGGPLLTPQNDSLGRTWENDHIHLELNISTVNVTVNPASIKYKEPVTPRTAPRLVYATAVAIGYAPEEASVFNITWTFTVDPSFAYLVRVHFCDIVSTYLYNLAFNVYINYDIVIPGLDLSTINEALKVPYFKDFIVPNSSVNSTTLTVGVGTTSIANFVNLTMNGLEIMKINNYARSLDGISSVDRLLQKWSTGKKGNGNIIGLVAAASVSGIVLICLCCCYVVIRRWNDIPHGYPWLAAIASVWELSKNDPNPQIEISQISGTVGFMSLSSSNLGRSFNFQEITDATNAFDESLILGVGGFGKVYLGTLADGSKVAIKRANPKSRQGPAEFRNEIKILSKARHRHLVSLLGYCDVQSEMILVYEYMANGTLRDHLYGTDFPSLSWKQRLEICIGAARGLHYLHTGAAQNIIHRDVKSTNILLDENFVAKVSDFGLSRIGPGNEDTHVSTVLKGTLGYFDPEYIRRQQLNAKSDVFSFGVVLMEVLCGRPVLKEVLPSEEIYLVDWAMSWQKKGLLDQIIDPNLVGRLNPASLEKFSETAEKCLAPRGTDRPTMGNVMTNLEYALQLETSSAPIELNDSSKGTEGNSAHIFTVHDADGQ